MKALNELLNLDEPAIPLVRQWVAEAEVPCEILAPGESRADTLVALQITTLFDLKKDLVRKPHENRACP